MYEFNYHRPSSIAEAKKLFSELDDASFLAGGHTLLPSMKPVSYTHLTLPTKA